MPGHLETCRYVHLRAHGQHNVDAPLFQTVFLAPSRGYDGRLRAHEVLALNLRGLEVVTLGACETALGRIDVSDNLRGLPAAVLLAGAHAVVGTLWPVMAEASTMFFTEFYRRVAKDGDDLIGAFAHAQSATRSGYPEYRDWGAFYMTGGYAPRGNSA
jgi:CHAT domain-containing protein